MRKPIIAIMLFTAAAALTAQSAPGNFVLVNSGTFTMGSPANEPGRDSDEGPRRQVTVNSFYMGKYEVTQREYEEIMGGNPSLFRGPDLPVENVTWYEAVEYCNRRSLREGLEPAYVIDGQNVAWEQNAPGYRLPTEAEWEYACRAGTVTPYSTGTSITADQANFNGRYEEEVLTENETGVITKTTVTMGAWREQITPVGSFPANAWGLHDMHGNVWEWCWDWYGRYPGGAQTNPRGPASGTNRVLRGGGWLYSARSVRSANRVSGDPNNRSVWFSRAGFRLARNAYLQEIGDR